MNIKKRIFIGIFLIAIFTSGAYLFEKVSLNFGIKSAKVIKITQDDKTIAFISSDILKQLMEQNLNENHDEAFGPSLSRTMHAAGINEFKKVEIKGVEKSIVLNEEEIKDDLVLFLKNDGSVSLCYEKENSNLLVSKITEIIIKN